MRLSSDPPNQHGLYMKQCMDIVGEDLMGERWRWTRSTCYPRLPRSQLFPYRMKHSAYYYPHSSWPKMQHKSSSRLTQPSALVTPLYSQQARSVKWPLHAYILADVDTRCPVNRHRPPRATKCQSPHAGVDRRPLRVWCHVTKLLLRK